MRIYVTTLRTPVSGSSGKVDVKVERGSESYLAFAFFFSTANDAVAAKRPKASRQIIPYTSDSFSSTDCPDLCEALISPHESHLVEFFRKAVTSMMPIWTDKLISLLAS